MVNKCVSTSDIFFIPLLFTITVDVVTGLTSEGLCEIMCANDLDSINETMEERQNE